MKIRTDDDGSLRMRESTLLLRLSALLGSAGLGAVLAWTHELQGTWTRGELTGGVIGIVALFALAASTPDRTFRFDRTTGELHWGVWRLLGWQTGRMPFDEVIRVSVRERIDSDSRRSRPEYQPILVTRSRTLPLSSFHHSNPTECESMSRAIYEAIGRRWQAAASGRSDVPVERGAIAAIVMARRRALAEGRPIGLTEAADAVRGIASNDSEMREAA